MNRIKTQLTTVLLNIIRILKMNWTNYPWWMLTFFHRSCAIYNLKRFANHIITSKLDQNIHFLRNKILFFCKDIYLWFLSNYKKFLLKINENHDRQDNFCLVLFLDPFFFRIFHLLLKPCYILLKWILLNLQIYINDNHKIFQISKFL
jgi:hypothetical protein